MKDLFPRVIHVYGVCLTQSKNLVLVCWQERGFTKSGDKAGFRHLLLKNIKSLEIMDETFSVNKEFNPEDSQYQMWLFHI